MGLPEPLLRGIYQYGFKIPSEIQQLAIRPIIDGKHVIAQAQSGTGKTGAFVVGILSRIDVSLAATQALIIAPTRELAEQICAFAKEISVRMTGFQAVLFIGGHSTRDDVKKARSGPHLVVATPGRLRALVADGSLRVDQIRVFCLDEADELFRQGFAEDVSTVMEFCPPGTQPMFFSATVGPESFEQMIRVLRDPVKILVEESKLTLEGIAQFYVNVDSDANKTECLLDVYGRLPIQKCIIFVNEKSSAEFFVATLKDKGLPVEAIHSDMPQEQREEVMKRFRVGDLRVLVGTDLIARGIDVQQVTLVLNLQLPRQRAQYLHRVGRSGRYGRKGVVINICNAEETAGLEEYRRFYHTVIDELDERFIELVAEANASV